MGDEATLKFHFPINFNAVHNEFIRKSDGQPRLFIVVSALQVFYLLLGEARRGRRGEENELPGRARVAGAVMAQVGVWA